MTMLNNNNFIQAVIRHVSQFIFKILKGIDRIECCSSMPDRDRDVGA